MLLRDLQFFLLTNKARFLAHRGQLHEALGLLEYVVNSRPENDRARQTMAQVNLDARNYAEAERLFLGLLNRPEVVLGRAICYYETDREDLAYQTIVASKLTQQPQASSEPLIDVLQNAQAILAGEAGSSDFLQRSVEDLSPAQQMFVRSLQARAALSRGRFEEALSFVQRSLARGDRNSAARRLAVMLSAATLDFTKASYYADTAVHPPIDWNAVLVQLKSIEDNLSTRTIAIPMATLITKRGVASRAARAWALAKAAEAGSTSTLEESLGLVDQACRDWPLEPRLELLRAEILESMGRPEEAYARLRDYRSRHRSYAVDLRMASLAGMPPDAILEQYSDYPNLVATRRASDFETTGGRQRDNELAFYQSGRCATVVEVPNEGEYFVVVTARGDRAFGLSPLVTLRIDGKKLDDIYVAREDWESYDISVSLSAGPHLLELEYVNNSERLPSNEEDRNFYLHSVMMTRSEGKERGHDAAQ